MFTCTPFLVSPRRRRTRRVGRLPALAVGLTLCATLGVLAASPRVATAAPPEYKVIDLGVLSGGVHSFSHALSYGSAVAGTSVDASGNNRATLFAFGTQFDMGVLPGFSTSIGSGVVDFPFFPIAIGTSYDPIPAAAFPSRGFVNFLGAVIDLGTLGGANTHASGITGQGFIVGDSEIAPGSSVKHAFRTFPYSLIDPATDDLGTLPGAASSFGVAVNDMARVTGQSGGHAFRTAPFSAIAPGDDLGTLGGTFSIGMAINEAGEVAGISTIATTSPVTGKPIDRAFLYNSTGMHNLGTLPGLEGSAATGINARHQVVGFAATFAPVPIEGPPNSAPRAFVWDKKHGLRDLNTLIPSGSGWSLWDAAAINDRGQIAGSGLHKGVQHAFLLIPL